MTVEVRREHFYDAPNVRELVLLVGDESFDAIEPGLGSVAPVAAVDEPENAGELTLTRPPMFVPIFRRHTPR